MGEETVPTASSEATRFEASTFLRLPLLVVALNVKDRIVFWNDECTRATGYSAHEALADPGFLRRLYPGPGRLESMFGALGRCEPGFRGVEQTLRTRSGELRTVAWSALTVPGDEASGLRWLVGHDSTDIHRSRDALRQSEARYRHFVEASRDLIALHEPDGHYRFVSPVVKDMLGYEPAELIGADPYDFYHPQDTLSVQRQAHEQVLAGKAYTTVRYRFRRRDGRYSWLETVAVPLFEDADDPLRVTSLLTTSRDVSDKIDADERLASGEERLRLALLASGLGILDVSLPDYTGHFSDQFLRIYGYGPEQRDAFERGWRPLVHPESKRLFVRNGDVIVPELGKDFGFEFRSMHRDGRYVWLRLAGRVVERGGARRLIGTLQDIDVRKRSEGALLESTARLMQAQSIARLGDWRTGTDDPRSRWSDEYFRLLGLEPGACTPSLEAFLAAVHPDDLDTTRRVVEAADRDGGEFTCRVLWPDGSVHHLQCATRVLFDDRGQRSGLAGTMQDVTERWRAEVALRAAAAELERAQWLAHLGNWRWTVADDKVTWSAALFRIFGLDPAGTAVPYGEQARLYAPESWQRLQRAVGQALSDGTPYELELELRRADGSAAWAQARGEVERNDRGRLLGLFGTLQDITAEKLTEAALRGARDRVRALSGHLEDELNRERKRIAVDVHDELGQMLTAMRLQLDRLRLQSDQPAAVERSTERLREMIEDTIEVTRNVAMRLSPPALELGLVPGLEWLAEDFALRYEVPCTVHADAADVVLAEPLATQLFRIVQESLTNIARHARASQVHLGLTRNDEGLMLWIQDNGVGFDPLHVPTHMHFGLFGMRERALRLCGTLQIDSLAGKGTEVRVILPASAEGAP